jgi:hypothetical protein
MGDRGDCVIPHSHSPSHPLFNDASLNCVLNSSSKESLACQWIESLQIIMGRACPFLGTWLRMVDAECPGTYPRQTGLIDQSVAPV